jgi:hypothetical protein
MKYVIFENDLGQIAVLIPNTIVHSTTFDMVRTSDLTTDRDGSWHKPIAAGFCQVRAVDVGPDYVNRTPGIEVICYGRSESLELESRGEADAVLVKKLLLDD